MAAPEALASDTTLRTCFTPLSCSVRRAAQSITIALSEDSSENRNWVGPDSASIVRSCTGCR